MAKKKGRARAGAKAMGKGLLAVAGFLAKRATVIGAASQYAEEVVQEHIPDSYKNKWYAGPALMLAGAVAIRKKPDYAKALAGAAGYAGAFNYKLWQYQNGQRDTSPVADFRDNPPASTSTSTPAPTTTQGYGDTGLREDAALFSN